MSERYRTHWAYVLAIVLPILTLLMRVSFDGTAVSRPALILFVIPVAVCAYLGGLRPGLLCTAWSALLSAYFLSTLFQAAGKISSFDFAQWTVFIATGVAVSYFAQRLLASQARLRNDESRLSGMFNSAMDGIVTVDDELTIAFVNPAAEKMFGYKAAALIGTSGRLLVPESHRRMCERLIKSLKVDGALQRLIEGPIIGVRANGEEFPVEATISKADIQGKPYFTLVLRDVSERKRAEAALREREALYRGLFESLSEGVIVWNAEGRIEACNASAERILGRSSAQIVGLHYTQIPWQPRSPREAQFDPENYSVAIIQRTGQPVERRERRLLRADGTEIWTMQTGVPLRLNHDTCPKVVVAFTDVTEARQKNATISQMADIVANSQDAIISESLDGIILTWNPGAQALTGYTAEEAIGQPAAQLLLRPEQHDAERKTRARIGRGDAVGLFETEMLRKNRQPLQVQVTASPIRDASQTIVGVSMIARDVTERRRAEDAIRERDAAQEANRLKSEFLATMSHELRTPLTGIIGFTEYLAAKQAGPINDEQAESLDNIHKSSLHLLDLINGVLDLSRIEAGKMEILPETFAVREVVEEVCAVISPLAQKKRIAVIPRVTPDDAMVTLDRSKLRQVLYNLLSNAVKFTDASGRVDVQAEAIEGPRLCIRVADTGIGIAAKDIDQLFRNFHQLDNRNARHHDGVGLGLALTKKIVELQHGAIAVESAPGEGSVFTVTLPC